MLETLYIDKSNIRIEQGDLIEGLSYGVANQTNEDVSFDYIEFPYTIVVTQDCDLEQDFNQRKAHETNEAVDHDKYLGTIWLLPAYTADAVLIGTHLKHLGLTMKKIDSDKRKPLKNNQVERFHFLQADTSRLIPALIIDFKHQYTITRAQLYAARTAKPEMSRFRIAELFREDLSARFANFLSRVALPEIEEPKQEITQILQ